MKDVIDEAQKEGVVIENNTDFFIGMASFFRSEGIDVKLDFSNMTITLQQYI